MCFDEKTGNFLWQAVFDKLAAGRVSDWPDEGICSSPVVEKDRLYFVNNRGELLCASVDGFQAGKTEPTMPGFTDKTDAGIIWRLDMMRNLGVFPHNLSTCSPLIVGDIIFLITSNGVDEGHINIPNPGAACWSFLAVNKKDGDGYLEKQLFPTGAAWSTLPQRPEQPPVNDQEAGRQRPSDDARPVVESGLRRAERQAADYLSRRRRLDVRLRAEDRRIDLEI